MHLFILTAVAAFSIPSGVLARSCAENDGWKIDGYCYHFRYERRKYNDASDACAKKENGRLGSIKSSDARDYLRKAVKRYSDSNLRNAVYWIGTYTDDTDYQKPKQDRIWKWGYDDVEFVQKDYTLWEKEGGPTDAARSCAAVNASNNFLVKGVSCKGSSHFAICMMAKDKTCKSDVLPYLVYGEHCMAVLNQEMEQKQVVPGCNSEIAAAYREEMRDEVILAIRNSFLGGAVFLNITRKGGNKFFDNENNKEVDDDWWEEDEPRGEYDCAGLALQQDETLKLRTINCEFAALFLCLLGN